jgi:hypothetical protein
VWNAYPDIYDLAKKMNQTDNSESNRFDLKHGVM